MIKAKDLKSKNTPELKELIRSLRTDLFNLNAEKASGKIKNTRSGKIKRKEIARALTVLRMKEEGK